MARNQRSTWTVRLGAVAIAAGMAWLAASPRIAAQRAATATSANWVLHNLDLAGSRFSTLDGINKSNIKTLTPRWLFQYGIIDGVSNQTTPVIVDGTMYVTDPRGGVYALDAADGHLLWSFDVTDMIGGGRREGFVFRHRGVVYADGVVYTAAGSAMYALDAKTGKPIPTFGKNGQSNVILDVVHERFPEVKAAINLGYWFTTAPQYYKGVLYIGSTRSESHIPGGHVLRSMPRPARCSGISTPFRRTKKIRAGRSPDRPGSAASETAGVSGKRRRSIRNSACSTSPSRIRSATAPSAPARTSSPIRSSRSSSIPETWSGTFSRRITTSGTTTPATSRSSST
jgi:hypothetical protein